ncbi:MAG: hypothetical protein DMG40_27240 [Acidobacteria bacterium]|nr:MAG: hypothetical protein DMG40_27240 [Acidobacteriota bacterium]
MVALTALWIPILLSAVIVFVASSILHMVLPYHRSDYKKLPDEDKVTAALRSAGVTRGLYMFPYCSHQDIKKPEMLERFKQGPVGTITLLPAGPVNMPKYLAQWFVYCVVVGLFTAYLTGRTIPAGTVYPAVFRVAGTVAFMAYGVGQLVNGIWRGQPWSVVIKEVVDGLVYSLLLAGTFGWLWPK